MTENTRTTEKNIHETYPCKNCGGPTSYKPGTVSTFCNYCGTENAIDVRVIDNPIELDFNRYAREWESLVEHKTSQVIKCVQCGAESTFTESFKSAPCPYCGVSLIESQVRSEQLIQPSYLAPFSISEENAKDNLSEWLKSRWFAPSRLGSRSVQSGMQPVFIPCWTFDALTTTNYSGERGENYQVKVKTEKGYETRTETRWHSCRGTVRIHFDDILVPASNRIPARNVFDNSQWELKGLVKADDRFLNGILTDKYSLPLHDGFKAAKDSMTPTIEREIRSDIGGDGQRIHGYNTSYRQVSFKLILLPVFISSYTYNNKLYHLYVNGKSGSIIGKRPYSAIKITFFVLFILTIITALIFAFSQ